jgi:ABC-type antimicrobial peptide transport system permease subunit
VLLVLEALCVVAVAIGCGLAFGLGIALIVGGALGVLACEWSGRPAARASR